MPDSVVPPVESSVSAVGASISRSGMPMNRPTWVESMMIRLSSFSTVSVASGATSQESPKPTECIVASSDALPTTG